MEVFSLNYVDIFIVILLSVTSLIGFSNGFIKEFLNFFNLFFSVLLALLLSNFFTNSIFLELNLIITIILFFVMFSLCFIILNVFTNYFLSDLNQTYHGYLNKSLGLIFGFIKGSLLILLTISGMIYLFYTTKDFPSYFDNSIFFEKIKNYSIKLIEKIVNFI